MINIYSLHGLYLQKSGLFNRNIHVTMKWAHFDLSLFHTFWTSIGALRHWPLWKFWPNGYVPAKNPLVGYDASASSDFLCYFLWYHYISQSQLISYFTYNIQLIFYDKNILKNLFFRMRRDDSDSKSVKTRSIFKINNTFTIQFISEYFIEAFPLRITQTL